MLRFFMVRLFNGEESSKDPNYLMGSSSSAKHEALTSMPPARAAKSETGREQSYTTFTSLSSVPPCCVYSKPVQQTTGHNDNLIISWAGST